MNENSFSYQRLCSKTHFEKQVQDNLEMAYFQDVNNDVSKDPPIRHYGQQKRTT